VRTLHLTDKLRNYSKENLKKKKKKKNKKKKK